MAIPPLQYQTQNTDKRLTHKRAHVPNIHRIRLPAWRPFEPAWRGSGNQSRLAIALEWKLILGKTITISIMEGSLNFLILTMTGPLSFQFRTQWQDFALTQASGKEASRATGRVVWHERFRKQWYLSFSFQLSHPMWAKPDGSSNCMFTKWSSIWRNAIHAKAIHATDRWKDHEDSTLAIWVQDKDCGEVVYKSGLHSPGFAKPHRQFQPHGFILDNFSLSVGIKQVKSTRKSTNALRCSFLSMPFLKGGIDGMFPLPGAKDRTRASKTPRKSVSGRIGKRMGNKSL